MYGSETTTVWLFWSCYMSVSSFLVVSYVYLGISLEKLVFWLALFLLYVQKLLKQWGCYNKSIFQKAIAWGRRLFQPGKYLIPQSQLDFDKNGFILSSPGVTRNLCLKNFKKIDIHWTISQK